MAAITEVRADAFVPTDLVLKTGQIKIESEEILTKDLSDIPLPPPSQRPTEVLSVDKGTPDSHVPRDPRLIRLTGVHPFNVEPPLTDLYKEDCLRWLSRWSLELLDSHTLKGFLTSPELFYVRNHGPVPYVKDEDIPHWEISVEGAKPLRKAKYVCMEGADKLPNGHYGTSIKLNWAMDPNRGIMLAHKMNGESLLPDHGRPLRAVVPGQIGGRSVKWLKRLILTDAPSDNWYHINDNRVLPYV
ncbi:hypothetical protein APSETT445_000469 [Aspergillus pseudonomiae]